MKKEVELESTTVFGCFGGARPFSGAATFAPPGAPKYSPAPAHSGLAAPEDGRAPMVLSRKLQTKVFAFLVVALLATSHSAFAEVLIVADEFPAMEVLASKLKSEEHIDSKLTAQKELPENLSAFQAVVVYIHKDLSEKAENTFIAYALGGGKLVLLHHSISSGKRKNAHWFSFLGVALPEGEVAHGGYKWIEGVSLDLVNLNPNHFIMTNKVHYPEQVRYTNANPSFPRGDLPGFKLNESEVYLNHVLDPSRTILMGLKFADEKNGTVYMQSHAGWIKSAGKGTVIYLMPGHTRHDFEIPAYSRIVLNAVIFKP